MNKKQKEIYSWLLSKPGYLKKGPKLIQVACNTEFGYLSINDISKALKQAKIDKKLYFNELVSIAMENPVKDTSWMKEAKALANTREVNIKKFGTEYHPKDVAFKKSKSLNTNVLVVSDMHEPFCKKGYLEHCIRIRDKYNCDKIILIGDEVDLCGVSQWEKDPDGFSAGTEAELAQQKMKLWYKVFPKASVCIGNHTARPFRQAKASGVPKKFIKSYEEAWEAPDTWKWADSWEIDNVFYTHGTGNSGAGAAIKIATRHRQNTVIGHIHSEAGIQYSASKIDLVWGMQVGGALDDNTYAAYYAKTQLKKSIIGCGVILDKGRLPIYEPMVL